MKILLRKSQYERVHSSKTVSGLRGRYLTGFYWLKAGSDSPNLLVTVYSNSLHIIISKSVRQFDVLHTGAKGK